MSKARDLADGDSRFVNASGDSMTGQLSSTANAVFTTQSGAGRGVGIANNVGDTSGAILQFTNNAVTAQLGYVAADANVIDVNNTNAGTFRVQNDGNLWRLWGGVWRPLPFATATGVLTGVALAGNSGTSVTMTFATSNRFTSAPYCFNSYWSNGYNAPSATNSGTTGILLRAWNPTGNTQTTGTHQWFAIQMLASTGTSN
jgi:hypothetical protein